MDNKLLVSFTLYNVLLWITCSFAIPSQLPSKGTCGRKASRAGRIVGGTNSFEGEFPWMISFKSKHGHFCGGFVISEKYVLSAAHCFSQSSANEHLQYFKGNVILSSVNATIGEFSLKTPEEIKDVTISLEELKIHPKYNPLTKDNDIAVIKLKEPITIHPAVEPICLPPTSGLGPTYTHKEVTAAGWGKMDGFKQDYYDWKEKADFLQKVEIKVEELEKCRKLYNGYQKFPTKSFICAGKNGKDSCTGDSGGPLMRFEENRWIAIGIVSVGSKCGETGKPSIYTDVSDYLEWIDTNLK